MRANPAARPAPVSAWSATATPESNAQDERWHGDLVAIDPSVRSPGIALFRHGVLVKADRIRLPDAPKPPEGAPKPKKGTPPVPPFGDMEPGARWLAVAHRLVGWWCDSVEHTGNVVRTVVYELPQIYTREKSKGDPNDLIGLAGVGQSVAVLFAAMNAQGNIRPPEILTPTPAEWCDQLPKAVNGKYPKDPRTSPRGARIWARLEEGEREVLPLQHDAFDSVGIGLHALGRFKRSRVFPGASGG